MEIIRNINTESCRIQYSKSEEIIVIRLKEVVLQRVLHADQIRMQYTNQDQL